MGKHLRPLSYLKLEKIKMGKVVFKIIESWFKDKGNKLFTIPRARDNGLKMKQGKIFGQISRSLPMKLNAETGCLEGQKSLYH